MTDLHLPDSEIMWPPCQRSAELLAWLGKGKPVFCHNGNWFVALGRTLARPERRLLPVYTEDVETVLEGFPWIERVGNVLTYNDPDEHFEKQPPN